MRIGPKITTVLLLLIGSLNAAFSQAKPATPAIPAHTAAPAQHMDIEDPPAPDAVQSPMPPHRKLGRQITGDYRIHLLEAPAMGWYEPKGNKLTWTDPKGNENEHLEVVLVNALDKKRLPDTQVKVSIYDQNNKLIDSKSMIMLWSTMGYHYGNNFVIPTTGIYNIKVDVEPPMFARHNKQLGNRFFNTATVTFKNVKLQPAGQAKE